MSENKHLGMKGSGRYPLAYAKNEVPENYVSCAYVVSFDLHASGDKSIAIVGQRDSKGIMNVVNAFEGKEAEELYRKLKGEKNDAQV